MTTIRHPWVPAVAALAGAAFTAKYLLMLGAGNSASDTIYAALYLSGNALGVIAAVGLGLRRATPWHRVVLSVLAPLLLLAWVMGLGEVIEPLAAQIGHTVDQQIEFPLGVLGVVLLAASYVGYRRDQQIGVPVLTPSGS